MSRVHVTTGIGARRLDPASVVSARPQASAHFPLIVIGAGPAGLAAALAARRAGIATMLVDEHPVASGLMGLDVPFHFGQRMDGAVQNKPRMVERLVETNPGLGEAFELGVEVQLGVYAAGAFTNGPTVHTMAKPLVMLADEERSWLVSCDRLIVAAGARDLGMSFAGWEKPGVMGAQAFAALLRRYRAFKGRRILVLGSGVLGLHTAAMALEEGVEVAGIVEVDSAVQGSEAQRAAALAGSGVPFHMSHALKEATGAAEVDGAVLVRLDATGAPIPESETNVACDTIVTAIGLVPNVELLDVLGCRLAFRAEHGGFVPVLGDDGRASPGFVQVVGDAAGISSARLFDRDIAIAEGARAGLIAAHALGAETSEPASPAAPTASGEASGYRQRWLEAEIAASGWEVNICQCEEVTRRELLELRPPRYLGWGSSQVAARDVAALGKDGPINQDQVKRLTRAGMGPCQGRRCREQVQMLLAKASGCAVAEVPLATYRAPVRPLPLGVLWPQDEPQAMRDHWVAWFDIPSQFSPHWEPDPASVDPTPPRRADGEELTGLARDEGQ